MAEVRSIYDGEELSPIAKIKQNLAIWTTGQWAYYMIDYQEPIPASPASIVDVVLAAGAVVIAANGTVAKQIITALQLNSAEMLHARWEPLDPVEGVLWELAGQQRLATKNITSRVDMFTRLWDPNLSTTTFFVLGKNRDMNLEARNPLAVPQPTARFQFFGHRYVLAEMNIKGMDEAKLKVGDPDYVARTIGPVTWLPAEGRIS